MTKIIKIPLWLFNIMPKFLLGIYFAIRFMRYFPTMLKDREEFILPGDKFTFTHQIIIQYPDNPETNTYIEIIYQT